MGFLTQQSKPRKDELQGYSLEFLQKHQCKVCPLSREIGLRHPQMEPHGTDQPLIYALGEAPGETEDRKGIPFVGKAGRVLHFRIPEEWEPRIRWNNCVRCRPPDNRDPSPIELACCRPSIEQDIEATKPKVVMGFGNVPLRWATQQTGITKWNGRFIPVKIGEHACWFAPMMHPSYISRTRKFVPHDLDSYGSELEFAFANDLKRVFKFADSEQPEPVVHTKEMAFENIEYVTGEKGDRDVDRIVEVLLSMYDETYVGFDYETKRIRPYESDARILTLAVSNRDFAFAFPLYHREAGWTDEQIERIEEAIVDFLYYAKCRKLVHNLAFEMEWSAYFYGRKSLRAGKWGDSISQAYVLDERAKCHSLDFLCMLYFGINIKPLNNLDLDNLDNEPLIKVLIYNGMDAKYHRALYLAQAKRLKEEGLTEVYQHHLRRIPTTVLTQLKGAPVDQKVVGTFFKQFDTRLKKIEAELSALKITAAFKKRMGHDFRPSANIDIKYVIRDMLKVPVADGVKDATDVKVLSKVKHPVAKLILQWREINKLMSTYVKPLRPDSPLVYPDGLLHPILSTIRTDTSRTSSDSPNIQNFPKRKHREIRGQIKPGGELRVVSFDYAGIQARNVAMESKDKALVKAFWDKYDIHSDWLEKIVKEYPKWVSLEKLKDKDTRKKYRDRAKNELVFPCFFGAQPFKLSRSLDIPEKNTTHLFEQFWDQFPDIKNWHERIFELYYETGYVASLAGYRRRAPISPNQIINAPIQADEAIIVLEAMNRLSEMELDRYQANFEVHDDLTFIWEKNRIEKNMEIVVKEMIGVDFPWINVPLVVEASVGVDWATMERVGEFSSDGWNGTCPIKQVA